MKTPHQFIVGTVYVALFLLAFGASLRQERADSVVHSLLWGSVSVYVLLWFLVWFLRGIYRRLAALAETEAAGSAQWRRQDRLITIVAVVVFVFNSFFLYRYSTLADPLSAAHHATVSFWATVFFLFWYPFGTASLAARAWHKHTNGKEIS